MAAPQPARARRAGRAPAWSAGALLLLLALAAAPAAADDNTAAAAAGAAAAAAPDDLPAFLLAQRAGRAAAPRAAGALGNYIVLLNDAPPLSAAPGPEGAPFRSGRPRDRRRGAGAATAAAAAAAADYSATLRARQAEVFASVAGASAASVAAAGAGAHAPRMTHQYTVAVNGFAAAGLTAEQAAALRARPDVLSVTPSRMVYPRTFSTPTYLGLKGAGGLWEREFGGHQNAAADVLIAVVDDGTDPTADSFASNSATAGSVAAAGDVSAAGVSLWPRLGPGTAACAAGAGTCTAGKLLACRTFEKGANSYVDTYTPDVSRVSNDTTCKSVGGHGVHTASTAGGNYGALPYGKGLHDEADGMSGMAPAAAVASYKVIWTFLNAKDGTEDSGAMTEDIVDAVDQAVADGADVLNFSLGGGPLPYSFMEPMWEAFKAAAAAGVVVSAAAGNEGVDAFGQRVASSVNENGCPWVLTVAAGTHPRKMYGEVTLSAPGAAPKTWRGSAGRTLTAVSNAGVYYPAASGDIDAGLCSPGKLDDSEAKGKVVICRRGVVDIVAKASEVARAGGVGMVLINTATSYSNLARQMWDVPTIHLLAADGAELVAAVNASAPGGCTISLSGQMQDKASPNEAPTVGAFSSRGPSVTDGYSQLKPDILSPGVDIFAAVPGGRGAYWDGTSMATPGVTGIAALVRSKHPDWSAQAIKSAIMTTAGQTTNRGNPIPGTPFDFGAGSINPSAALDPGLVYNASRLDYDRYSCAAVDKKAWAHDSSIQQSQDKPKVPAYCAAACAGAASACAYPQALRDFNAPSVSLPGLRRGGRASARRAATYVGDAPAGGATVTFAPTLELPDGFKGRITVDRRSNPKVQRSGTDLAFAGHNEERAFVITVTAGAGAPAGWSFGSLTWRDAAGRYAVRIPIAVERV